MRRRAALVLPLVGAALAAAGCAGGRWSAGPRETGYQVQTQAPTVEQARRQAVSQFFDLFLSSTTQAESSAVLDREILAKAGTFILKESVRRRKDSVRLSAVVAWARLGRELDALGLVRGRAFATRPRLSLRLSADGGQAPALDALRSRLAALGYRFSGSGAEVVITGAATTKASEQPLAGLAGATAVLKLKAADASGAVLAEVEQPSGAVDARAEDAAARALQSAGALAADALHARLAARFPEATGYTITVLELGDLERARQWVAALRALPQVADAALDAVSDKDFRVRLYARGTGIDELTAQLLHLRGFTLHVRGVEPDFGEIELASGDSF